MKFLKTAALGLALTFASTSLGAAHDYKAGDIAIGHPWARATLPNASVGGAYLTLDNRGSEPDRLLGGSSPVAEDVQIHAMEMEGDVMRMRALEEGVPVPAGEEITFAPGALHLMLTGLKEPLVEGSRVPMTLNFEKAGEVDVELAVEGAGASEDGMDHGSMDHGAASGSSSPDAGASGSR